LETGDPDGPVVMYFHGTASAKVRAKEELPLPDIAERLRLRLLIVDRPGYGRSAANSDASLLDLGRMVLGNLDDEGVDRFSVLGYSGGGPHALACAAVARSRIRVAGIISSWAPMNPPHRGLPVGVRFAMRVAAGLPRPAIQAMLVLGTRSRATGMVDDVRRVAVPWGFDVEEVASTVRVVAWHAEGDRQVPVAPWRGVRGIELNVVAGDAHEVPRELWEAALRGVANDPQT
jgi:pimeloyl-ACP methyl ester carboxylesterase